VKTISLKKVSAVAVASLGFGLLSAVPVNSASSAAVVGTATQSGVVGTSYTTTVGSTILNSDTNPGTLSLSVPAGSAVTMADRDGSFSAATTAVLTSTATGFAFTASSGAVAITATPTSFSGTVTIIPDVPGTYAVTFTAAGAGTGAAAATAYMNIAGAAGTVGTGGLGTTAITATAGGEAAFTYTNPSADASGTVYSFASSGVGSIVIATGKRADGTTDNNPVPSNGSAADWSAGAKWTTGDAASATATVRVRSTTAGTQTVNITKLDAATGAPIAAATVAITWNSGTSLNLTTLQVTILPGNDTANCTVANKSNAAHGSVVRVPASDQTDNDASDANLCVLALNGSGAAVTLSALTVGVSGPGLIGQDAIQGNNANDDVKGIASVSTVLTGAAAFNLYGSLISGKATYLVTAKATNSDGVTSTTLTGSASVNFVDSTVAKATITQTKGALDVDSGAVTVATLELFDKNNFAMAGGANGDLLVDSDAASTVTIDEAGESDASAAVTVSTASSITAAGVVTKGVISVDCAAGKYEKLTIKAHYASNTVPSNAIVVYCTEGNVDSLVIDAVNSGAGASQTVKITAKAGIVGKADYPVADFADDGTTAITAGITATQGVLSSASPAFVGGVATVTFNAPLAGGPVILTVKPSATTTAGAALATTGVAKTITIGASSDITSLATSISALNAKIVALNALIAKIMKRLNIR